MSSYKKPLPPHQAEGATGITAQYVLNSIIHQMNFPIGANITPFVSIIAPLVDSFMQAQSQGTEMQENSTHTQGVVNLALSGNYAPEIIHGALPHLL